MNSSDFGLPQDDEYTAARLAKRRMTAIIVAATRAEPPHLVDILVINDQNVGIWYTLEPFNEIAEQSLQGWDVKRRRFVTFPWAKIVNTRINSANYNRATPVIWERRQMLTNLQWDEDKEIRQSVGVFWRGKRPHRRIKKAR